MNRMNANSVYCTHHNGLDFFKGPISFTLVGLDFAVKSISALLIEGGTNVGKQVVE